MSRILMCVIFFSWDVFPAIQFECLGLFASSVVSIAKVTLRIFVLLHTDFEVTNRH